MALDWEEYKAFKAHCSKEDKLAIAVDFLKSYYNMQSPREMFNMLNDDDIGLMMLEKRDIETAEDLENFMFKS